MNTSIRNNRGITSMLKGFTVRRGMAWGAIIIGALLAFEMFNYSTTQFALNDVLGDLKFAGLHRSRAVTSLLKSGTCSGPGSWQRR
jgi:hypothetical protein